MVYTIQDCFTHMSDILGGMTGRSLRSAETLDQNFYCGCSSMVVSGKLQFLYCGSFLQRKHLKKTRQKISDLALEETEHPFCCNSSNYNQVISPLQFKREGNQTPPLDWSVSKSNCKTNFWGLLQEMQCVLHAKTKNRVSLHLDFFSS